MGTKIYLMGGVTGVVIIIGVLIILKVSADSEDSSRSTNCVDWQKDDCGECEGDKFFGTENGDLCSCSGVVIDKCGDCDGN